MHAGTFPAPKLAVPVRSEVNGLAAGKKLPQPTRRREDKNLSLNH